MVDLEGEGAPVALLPVVRGVEEKLLVASSDGRGFVATMADIVAETRKGKQVLNLRAGAELKIFRPMPADADYVAVVGDNRKLVVFPLARAARNGARIRACSSSAIATAGCPTRSAIVFADGLSWTMGGETGRIRTEADLTPWRTARGAGGRMAPLGFPRDNRFGPLAPSAPPIQSDTSESKD